MSTSYREFYKLTAREEEIMTELRLMDWRKEIREAEKRGGKIKIPKWVSEALAARRRGEAKGGV